MSDEKIQQLLVQLHEQLQEKNSLEGDTQVLLQQVLDDVKASLASDEGELEQDLTDLIEQQAVHFEQEHPTLSVILRQIIDTLGRIGV